MSLEEFIIPSKLEQLIPTDRNFKEERIKKEIDAMSDDQACQMLKKDETFIYIIWAISKLKEKPDAIETVCERLETVFVFLYNRVHKFIESPTFRADQRFPIDLTNYVKKAICLFELLIKNCLKKTKKNLMDIGEERPEKRADDPISQRILELFKTICKIMENSGANIISNDTFVHFFEVLFYIASTELISKTIAIEYLSKQYQFLLTTHPELNIEFQKRTIVLLEDGVLESGEFMGKFLATCMLSPKPNLVKIADETILRVIHTLMGNKPSDSPIYKISRELLCNFVSMNPKYFYNHYIYFECLFGCDHYTIRGFVCEALFITANFLKENSENDAKLKSKIESYFDICRERIYDKSAYTRVTVLGCLSSFMTLNILEKDSLKILLKISCERLSDASIVVRKKALSLNQEIILALKSILPSYEEVTANQSKLNLSYAKSEDENDNSHDEIGFGENENDDKYILKDLDNDIGSLTKKGRSNKKSQLFKQNNKNRKKTDINQNLEDKKSMEDNQSDNDSNLNYIVQKRNLNISVMNQRFYEEIYEFIGKSLDICKLLIFSKNPTEIIETLRYLYLLVQLKFDLVFPIFYKCFNLIWTKEQVVKEELLLIFHRTYIQGLIPRRVIDNIHTLYSECDFNTLICVEEIISQLFKREVDEKERGIDSKGIKIQISIKKNLWETFLTSIKNDKLKHAMSSIKILKICVGYYPKWIADNFKDIHSLFRDFYVSSNFSFEILHMLASILVLVNLDSEELKDLIIKCCLKFVLKFLGTNEKYFIKFVERVIFMIFHFKSMPEIICDFLLQKVISFCFADSINHIKKEIPDTIDDHMDMIQNDSKNQSQKFIHLLVISREISLKLIYYFEKLDFQLKSQKNKSQENNNAQEIDLATGGVEADYENQKEQLDIILNEDIFQNGILAKVLAIVKKIVVDYIVKQSADREKDENNEFISESQNKAQKYEKLEKTPEEQINGQLKIDEPLDTIFTHSLDCLVKMMIVSKKICADNIAFLFDILEDPKRNQQLASNIIIYIGDLFHRFPNILNSYMSRIFIFVRSQSVILRRTTLIVLSHLILNDFIKMKAEIADFVFLLEDEDNQIREISNLFFQEITEKEKNFVVNVLPDAISRLSGPLDQGGIGEREFEVFAKHFLRFIAKEQISDLLIEKMLIRMKMSKNEKETRNTVFCIFLLVSNEKMVDKLMQNSDKLRVVIDVMDVREILSNMIHKVRSNTKIPKVKVDDLENYLFKTSDDVFDEFKKKKDKEKEKHTNVKRATKQK